MSPTNREDWVVLMDSRVQLGIKEYDLRIGQERHKENTHKLEKLRERQESIERRLAYYAGAMVVLIPVLEWIIRKFLG